MASGSSLYGLRLHRRLVFSSRVHRRPNNDRYTDNDQKKNEDVVSRHTRSLKMFMTAGQRRVKTRRLTRPFTNVGSDGERRAAYE